MKLSTAVYGQYFLKFFEIGWILDTKIVSAQISQFFAISQLRPSGKLNCVMLRLRPALRKMNYISCEIAIFSQSQFRKFAIFSQSILQPWNGRPLLESIFGCLSGFSFSGFESGFGLIIGWEIKQFRIGGFVEHGSIGIRFGFSLSFRAFLINTARKMLNRLKIVSVVNQWSILLKKVTGYRKHQSSWWHCDVDDLQLVTI